MSLFSRNTSSVRLSNKVKQQGSDFDSSESLKRVMLLIDVQNNQLLLLLFLDTILMQICIEYVEEVLLF